MSNDLTPEMRERVDNIFRVLAAWRATSAECARSPSEASALGMAMTEAELIGEVESLARDLQTARADFQRAELARARAEAALRRYGRHRHDCGISDGAITPPTTCTCGYAAAVDAMAKGAK